MKYQANPVIVDAYKILSVAPGAGSGPELLLSNGERVVATQAMTSRMDPEVGDYWVIQEDGYAYLNPAGVFLRKYTAVGF